MKTLFIPAALMLAAGLSACGVTAETEKAPGVDLSQYKTFQWASPAKEKHAAGIMDQDIKDGITNGLRQKGLTASATSADLVVDYNIGSYKGRNEEAETVYTHPYTSYWIGRHGRIYSYWNPAYPVGTRYHEVPFTENVLTVDVKDPKTGKIVWEGRAEADMTNHPLTARQAHKDVETLFKHFG